MTLALADRLIARDDTALDEIRAIGDRWRHIHLADPSAPTSVPAVTELLRPDVMRHLIGEVARVRRCRRPEAARIVFDALVWTVSAPVLTVLVAHGVGLSAAPGDVRLQLNADGGIVAVLIGEGPRALLYGLDDDPIGIRRQLAPWVGQQIDDALGHILHATWEATRAAFEGWRAQAATSLDAVRARIEARYPAGRDVLGEVARHVAFAIAPLALLAG